MRNFIAIITLIIIFGSPETSGYTDAPTGERIWWKWFSNELIVMDSNGQCLANTDGTPVPCDGEQASKMLFNLY